MNPDFHADIDELWHEYNNKMTSFERRVQILFTLAYNANQANDPAKELFYIDNAIDMSKHHNITDGMVSLVCHKARILTEADRLDEVLELLTDYEATLPPVALDHSELDTLGAILMYRANTLRALKRHAEALRAYRDYTEVQERLGNDTYAAWSIEFSAMSLIELEDFDQAEIEAHKAREIYLRHDRPKDVADLDALLGRVMLARKQPKLAIKLLKEARDAQRAMRGSSTTRTKLYLGLAYAADGNLEQAEKYLNKAANAGRSNYGPDYDIYFEASMALADVLDKLQRGDEATAKRNQATAVVSRLKGAQPNQFSSQDIDYLLKKGDTETAEAMVDNNVLQAAEAGDINEYFKSQYLKLRTFSLKHDFEGAVALYESLSKPSLDSRDDIVIEFKNLVTYALFRVGRVENAMELNAEIFADSRLEGKIQEAAYAKENLAKCYRAINKIARSNKCLKEAAQLNLQAGNHARAVELIERIGEPAPRKPKQKKQDEKDSPNAPESY